jgi:hypothetical protein
MMSRENHKFWAFIILVLAVVLLGIVATFLGGDSSRIAAVNDAQLAIMQARIRILELIAVGLVGIVGVAAQALFRTSETAGQMNEILKSTIDGLKKSAPIDTPDSSSQSAAEGAKKVADAADKEADKIKDSAQ